MAMSPDQMANLAEEIRDIYSDLELKIIDMISKRLAKNLQAPDWQTRKLIELQQVLRIVNKLVGDAEKASLQLTQDIIERGWAAGISGADADYINAYGSLSAFLTSNINTVNNVALVNLVAESQGLIKTLNYNIIRRTNDIYANVIREASIEVITGVSARKQAVQNALNRFAATGITGFVDKAGKNWNIASYADMAIRTAVGRASMAGHETRITQLGEDLVIVSEHPDECSICRPWEGKVLSISGTDPRYRSLSSAKAAGLFHPNCGHTATLYVDGVTSPIVKKTGTSNNYEKKQRLNEINRNIRKWKLREAAAIDPIEKNKATNKVKEWLKIRRDL